MSSINKETGCNTIPGIWKDTIIEILIVNRAKIYILSVTISCLTEKKNHEPNSNNFHRTVCHIQYRSSLHYAWLGKVWTTYLVLCTLPGNLPPPSRNQNLLEGFEGSHLGKKWAGSDLTIVCYCWTDGSRDKGSKSWPYCTWEDTHLTSFSCTAVTILNSVKCPYICMIFRGRFSFLTFMQRCLHIICA